MIDSSSVGRDVPIARHGLNEGVMLGLRSVDGELVLVLLFHHKNDHKDNAEDERLGHTQDSVDT